MDAELPQNVTEIIRSQFEGIGGKILTNLNDDKSLEGRVEGIVPQFHITVLVDGETVIDEHNSTERVHNASAIKPAYMLAVYDYIKANNLGGLNTVIKTLNVEKTITQINKYREIKRLIDSNTSFSTEEFIMPEGVYEILSKKLGNGTEPLSSLEPNQILTITQVTLRDAFAACLGPSSNDALSWSKAYVADHAYQNLAADSDIKINEIKMKTRIAEIDEDLVHAEQLLAEEVEKLQAEREELQDTIDGIPNKLASNIIQENIETKFGARISNVDVLIRGSDKANNANHNNSSRFETLRDINFIIERELLKPNSEFLGEDEELEGIMQNALASNPLTYALAYAGDYHHQVKTMINFSNNRRIQGFIKKIFAKSGMVISGFTATDEGFITSDIVAPGEDGNRIAVSLNDFSTMLTGDGHVIQVAYSVGMPYDAPAHKDDLYEYQRAKPRQNIVVNLVQEAVVESLKQLTSI